MKKTSKLQISENTSKHLFLSNLKPDNSNDDKIENVILSLKKIVKSRSNEKLGYLDSLEYKLRHIRYRNIISSIEEEKEIKSRV